MEEEIPSPALSAAAHTAKVISHSSDHGLPAIEIPGHKKMGLELELTGNKANLKDFQGIAAEMRAFGPVTRIKIDDDHHFFIGSTPALDPHTYVHLPAADVAYAYRDKVGLGQEEKASYPEHGFPEGGHIKLTKDNPRLCLHLLNWCFVETKNKDGTVAYQPLGALSFFAKAKERLVEMGCNENADLDTPIKAAFSRMTELALINRDTVTELYNAHILPQMVEALLTLDAVITYPENVITLEQKKAFLTKHLTRNVNNQRIYENLGHSSQAKTEKFDTGRGPATIECRHQFTRYIPFERLVMLIGNHDPNLDPAEYDKFETIIKALSEKVIGLDGELFITQKTFEQLAQWDTVDPKSEFSRYLKMIDPYTDYLATYVTPVEKKLADLSFAPLRGKYNITIEERDHIASKETLPVNHGKSIRIIITEKQGDHSNEAIHAFGTRVLNEAFAPLQQFYATFNTAYEKIFEKGTEGELTSDSILALLKKHAPEELRDDPSLDRLAQALEPLQPTAKMIASRNAESEPKDNASYIQKLDATMALIRLLINDPEKQQKIATYLAGNASDDATTVQKTILKIATGSTGTPLPSLLPLDERHGEVYSSSEQAAARSVARVFGKQKNTLEKITMRMHQLLVLSAIEFERMGKRTGPRPFNIPSKPGFLMSYQVRERAEGRAREVVIEIGASNGSRGAVESASGLMLQRAADGRKNDK